MLFLDHNVIFSIFTGVEDTGLQFTFFPPSSVRNNFFDTPLGLGTALTRMLLSYD